MRPGQNRRMRGRSRGNKGPNPLTRSFESNGPDVKIRGTAQHIADKYAQLARDAQASGDPVSAESYLQHAEHYYRLIAAAQEQFRQQYGGQRPDEDGEGDDEGFGPGDGQGDEFGDGGFQAPAFEGRNGGSVQPRFDRQGQGPRQPRPDRGYDRNGGYDRQAGQGGYDRQDRQGGQDRPGGYDRDRQGGYDRQGGGYDRQNGGDRQERYANGERPANGERFERPPNGERNERPQSGERSDRRDRFPPRDGYAARPEREPRQERDPRQDRSEGRRDRQGYRGYEAEDREAGQPGDLPAFLTNPVRAAMAQDEGDGSPIETSHHTDVVMNGGGDPEINGVRPRRRRARKPDAVEEGGFEPAPGGEPPTE